MSLSSADLSWLRRKVGSSPGDDELNALYAELGSREEVAAQVLETRYADAASSPTSISIADEISVSRAGQSRTLRDQLKELRGFSDARIIRPVFRSRR